MLTSDRTVMDNAVRSDGQKYLQAAEASRRIPLPWLLCFQLQDLRPVQYRSRNEDGSATLHEVLLPCTSVENAVQNITNALPIYKDLTGNEALAREFWLAAIHELKGLPLPYLAMEADDLLYEADLELKAFVISAALCRDPGSFIYLQHLSHYNHLFLPYRLSELNTGFSGRERDDDFQNRRNYSIALDFGNSWFWYDFPHYEKSSDSSSSSNLFFDEIPFSYRENVNEDILREDASVNIETFRISINGVGVGFSEDQVIDKLMPLLGCTAARITSILRGQSAVVKKGVNLEIAEKYKVTLEKMGCVCAIERESKKNPEYLKVYQLAEQNDMHAQACIGYQYEMGLRVEQNFGRAAEWYLRAAENGHAKAQYKLGYLYARGLGVQQSATQAANWLRRPAGRSVSQLDQIAEHRAVFFSQAVPEVSMEQQEIAQEWLKRSLKGEEVPPLELTISYTIPEPPALPEQNTDPQICILRLASQNGDAEAQLQLGLKYFEGDTLPQDHVKAFELFNCSAQSGNVDAQYYLADMYDMGYGVSEDPRKAEEWWLKAAEQGHPEAQWEIACMYHFARGIPADLSRAIFWYHKAADQGHILALGNLANAYTEGEGVNKDIGKAFALRRQAAEFGDGNNQLIVALMLFNGEGTRQDNDSGFKFLLKAAEKNVDASFYYLGLAYSNGLGVQRDYREALGWFRRAADLGSASAQAALGDLYREGAGVLKDHAEAHKWYSQAAEQGHTAAQVTLGFFYYNGLGVSQDYTEALRLYRKAADKGNSAAQFNLGLAFRDGKGVRKDLVQCQFWLRKAAAQGDVEASQLLEEIKNRPFWKIW